MPALSATLVILPYYLICYDLFKGRNGIFSQATVEGLCRLFLVSCLKIGSLFPFSFWHPSSAPVLNHPQTDLDMGYSRGAHGCTLSSDLDVSLCLT